MATSQRNDILRRRQQSRFPLSECGGARRMPCPARLFVARENRPNSCVRRKSGCADAGPGNPTKRLPTTITRVSRVNHSAAAITRPLQSLGRCTMSGSRSMQIGSGVLQKQRGCAPAHPLCPAVPAIPSGRRMLSSPDRAAQCRRSPTGAPTAHRPLVPGTGGSDRSRTAPGRASAHRERLERT